MYYAFKTRGCDLYEGQQYAVSQCQAILGNWVKFMGATYMRVRPICEDIRYYFTGVGTLSVVSLMGRVCNNQFCPNCLFFAILHFIWRMIDLRWVTSKVHSLN